MLSCLAISKKKEKSFDNKKRVKGVTLKKDGKIKEKLKKKDRGWKKGTKVSQNDDRETISLCGGLKKRKTKVDKRVLKKFNFEDLLVDVGN